MQKEKKRYVIGCRKSDFEKIKNPQANVYDIYGGIIFYKLILKQYVK